MPVLSVHHFSTVVEGCAFGQMLQGVYSSEATPGHAFLPGLNLHLRKSVSALHINVLTTDLLCAIG